MVEKFKTLCGPVLASTNTHTYLAPHPLLRPYIAHYTVQYPDPTALSGASLTLIPDASGCLVFMVHGDVSAYCWGATTRTVTVDNSPDRSEMYLFIEFLPGGGRRLTGFAQQELTDFRVPLSLLDRPLEQKVISLLENAGSLWALSEGLDMFFLDRLARFSDLPKVLQGLNTLSAATVRDLADSGCYSQRHLGRLFLENTGMGMKTYLRLLRINRALRLIRPGLPLTWVAQEAGYYDQSHFNHEFKSVCGVSPSTYLRSMSDFYSETLKF